MVGAVLPGGPADLDGRLLSGDIVTRLNGVALRGKTNAEAQRILHTGGDTVTFAVAARQRRRRQSSPEVRRRFANSGSDSIITLSIASWFTIRGISVKCKKIF